MKLHRSIPLALIALAAVGLSIHGDIRQFADYHDFADRRSFFGTPNFFDVWSNLPFLIVGVWGWWRLSRARGHPALARAWSGYVLFFIGLIATAAGSAYYHLAPDDARLVWDRLPIALVCAGLMAAAYAEVDGSDSWLTTLCLGVLAALSVWWWDYSGDLGPYLVFQTLPVILLPIWFRFRQTPRGEWLWFFGALAFLLAARAGEFFDDQVFAALGGTIGGHSLKHVFFALAGACIVYAVAYRVERDGTKALAPLGINA
jgi:hypothetical protein